MATKASANRWLIVAGTALTVLAGCSSETGLADEPADAAAGSPDAAAADLGAISTGTGTGTVTWTVRRTPLPGTTSVICTCTISSLGSETDTCGTMTIPLKDLCAGVVIGPYTNVSSTTATSSQTATSTTTSTGVFGQVPDAADGSQVTNADAGQVPDAADASQALCLYEGKSYDVGIGWTAVDNCNHCLCTEGGQVACTNRVCSFDAGPTPYLAGWDGCSVMTCRQPGADAQGCSLPTSIHVAPGGSMVQAHSTVTDYTTGTATSINTGVARTKWYFESFKLTPPWSYEHRHGSMVAPSPPPDLVCSPALPDCASAIMNEILADLGSPEVQAAFALPPFGPEQYFGVDRYPRKSSWIGIDLGDGRMITVGDPCPAAPDAAPCRPIPARVQDLVDRLLELDAYLFTSPECSALRE